MKYTHPITGKLRKKTGFLIFPKTLYLHSAKTAETRWLIKTCWVERYDPIWGWLGKHWDFPCE